jgi:LacI family transcriptional regulator
VALVVPDLENPMFQGVLKGLSREAALDGYRVLVSPRMPAERLEALLARSGPAASKRILEGISNEFSVSHVDAEARVSNGQCS